MMKKKKQGGKDLKKKKENSEVKFLLRRVWQQAPNNTAESSCTS